MKRNVSSRSHDCCRKLIRANLYNVRSSEHISCTRYYIANVWVNKYFPLPMSFINSKHPFSSISVFVVFCSTFLFFFFIVSIEDESKWITFDNVDKRQRQQQRHHQLQQHKAQLELCVVWNGEAKDKSLHTTKEYEMSLAPLPAICHFVENGREQNQISNWASNHGHGFVYTLYCNSYRTCQDEANENVRKM